MVGVVGVGVGVGGCYLSAGADLLAAGQSRVVAGRVGALVLPLPALAMPLVQRCLLGLGVHLPLLGLQLLADRLDPLNLGPRVPHTEEVDLGRQGSVSHTATLHYFRPGDTSW